MMFLAIVTDIIERDEQGRITAVNAMPIKTNTLETEILSRCRFPLVATRAEMQERLRKALQEIETDTKNQTIYLAAKHG